jgi:SAM-dependent methyltransferase
LGARARLGHPDRVQRNPYVGAYPFLPGRAAVWREIARYVRRDAPDAESVIELGAGYCDFINQFPAARRIAFDLNPDMQRFAARGVELRIGDAAALPGVAGDSTDLVFASNFFEHFSEEQLRGMLARIRECLRGGGRLIILQPNYARCAEHYFDDPTHVTIFADASLPAFFARHGFETLKLVPGLLPFSMKSRLPKSGLLTRLYMHSPIRPFAAQMYAVMRRA